jgi:hexosaminidase
MKNIIFLLLAILCTISCGQNKMEVEWYEGERDPETGIKKYTIVLKNIPKDARDWSLWFSMPWCKNFATDSLSTAQLLEVEAVSYRIVPFRNEDGTAILSPGDSVVVNFYSPVRFSFRAWDAEGFAFQNGDEEPEEVNVNYHYLPLADDTERVNAFGSKMKYIEPSLHDMIPSLKEVEYSANMSEVHIKADDLQVRHISENHPKGWYRLIIGEESYAEVTDRSGARYARTTLLKLLENSTDGTLPCMKIEDWPDLEHRGLMLDVARKFVPVWKLKEYLDLMSRYKLNILHLHLTDDDGWRLEIPGLEELTSVGGFRAIPEIDECGRYQEDKAMIPSYDGTISRSDTTRLANGFYTSEDFADLLLYADSLCIKIVPEVDLPGHARAAIVSMNARNKILGYEEMVLTDSEDSSLYRSATGYFYNTMDVAKEDPYRLIEKVFDGIIEVYAKAGLPLDEIHVGGDEVPKGAWMGSPSCHRLLERNGFDVSRIAPWARYDESTLTKEQKAARNEAKRILRSHYTERLLDIAEERGVKVSGWHEMVGNLDKDTYQRLIEQTAWVNYWRSKADYVHKMTNDGFPVVLSNGSNTYADEGYSANMEEFGNFWAGPVDEKRSYALLPYDLYRSIRWDFYDKDKDLTDPGRGQTQLNTPENIKGVQVQLFMGAAIRSYDDMEYMLFPKALGAFERAWNARPEWAEKAADKDTFTESFNRFYSIILDREIPFYAEKGMRFHIPQPVIEVIDGRLYGYTHIPGAVIRYEKGDKTPTEKSPELEGPMTIDTDMISARLFYLGEHSVSTIWRK